MSLLELQQAAWDPSTFAAPEVDVAVLGPVEIRGAARPFCRSSSRELVVYLAFHRQGARNDVWATALWTDRCIAASTIHSTTSVARSALGRSVSGSEHLPRGGRRLRLADTVGTDVERFARAAADPDPARWKDALALVRGRPFDGLQLGDWAVLDGTQARLESMVVDTAVKAAEHFLARGCGEEAAWVIRQGLLAGPYDERLYRGLLWATEVMGNRAGLRSTMEELLCLATDGSGRAPGLGAGTAGSADASSVHPETVALFWDLSRRKVPATRGDPLRL
jgi:DNA-binding SARP family transcriptional activator